ncbi:hypothetical protein EOL96_07985 [Candidatus Saccharibacteria bacterium]|nr:hypothetical protein [Candidatus Saccharibacteria bacterium]
MLHRFRSLFVTSSLSIMMSGLAMPVAVGAIQLLPDCPAGVTDSQLCASKDSEDATTLAQNLINLLLFLIGIVAVVMIVIGGFHYVVSNGDANKTAAAKNTILYSVIGLIVAILASFIVTFVVDQFK